MERKTYFIPAILQGLHRLQRFHIFANLFRLLHDSWSVLTSALVQLVSSTVTRVNLNRKKADKIQFLLPQLFYLLFIIFINWYLPIVL